MLVRISWSGVLGLLGLDVGCSVVADTGYRSAWVENIAGAVIAPQAMRGTGGKEMTDSELSKFLEENPGTCPLCGAAVGGELDDADGELVELDVECDCGAMWRESYRFSCARGFFGPDN